MLSVLCSDTKICRLDLWSKFECLDRERNVDASCSGYGEAAF